MISSSVSPVLSDNHVSRINRLEIFINKCGNLGFKSESYVYFKK